MFLFSNRTDRRLFWNFSIDSNKSSVQGPIFDWKDTWKNWFQKAATAATSRAKASARAGSRKAGARATSRKIRAFREGAKAISSNSQGVPGTFPTGFRRRDVSFLWPWQQSLQSCISHQCLGCENTNSTYTHCQNFWLFHTAQVLHKTITIGG